MPCPSFCDGSQSGASSPDLESESARLSGQTGATAFTCQQGLQPALTGGLPELRGERSAEDRSPILV